MVNPVGFRFCPTDEEIVYHYILPKNLKSDTSHVDGVISTVDICSCDPWDLPSKSMIKSKDKIWYFFGRKNNKYKKGDQQRRTTKSGYWTKTGKTTMITTRNEVKIGEKRVLVFRNNGGGSKSDWVIHEYHATTPLSSPNQMTMIYTLCRLEYKGDESEISYSSVAGGGIEIEQSHYFSPLVSNSAGSEESLFELDQSKELQNPSQLSDFEVLYLLEETQLEHAMDMAFNNIASDDWKSFFSVDEQNIIVSMQERKFVEFN